VITGAHAIVFAEDPDVSAEPFARPGDALLHPQMIHTGDSIEVDDPAFGRTRQLGPLFTASAQPATEGFAAPRGAPSLLQGITVLELATWIATPMATALLSELGARVIKIEPLAGDPLRGYGPVGLKCVQGKESITLDLKTTEGRDIVHRLVERADALVHNFRPGVPERLGIDDATLRPLNPGLIHLYAASYGSTGPMSAKPAFHVTAGAVCGGALAQSGGDGAPGPDVVLSDEELARWSERLTRSNEANPDFNAALVVAAVRFALEQGATAISLIPTRAGNGAALRACQHARRVFSETACPQPDPCWANSPRGNRARFRGAACQATSFPMRSGRRAWFQRPCRPR
jgi:crotonobetainyl-CoA:carnitine CoA-transferase CaiB-like acyl-CoA transferase